MDNKTLHDNFRAQLTNVHAATVSLVSLFEIIGYMVLIHSGQEQWSLRSRYLWCNVVLPIVINAAAHFTARALVQLHGNKPQVKNASIISATLVTSLVVAVLHKEYMVAGCAFVFPMALAAMFNDRKLVNASFFASLFIIVCMGFACRVDGGIDLTTGLNLFLLFGFAIVSYLCSVISISFSNQNYTTIESQAKANDKLRSDVSRDQMTGLYNHNAFLQQLDASISDPEDGPLCLAMIDVDHFKQINDTYGHDCGDEVLIFLARLVKEHCGKEDIPCRYGGEEFAVIFRHKSIREVRSVMEHILDAFRTHSFDFCSRPITFSAGLVMFEEGTDPGRLFELADQTMYRAKQSGRNRILEYEA